MIGHYHRLGQSCVVQACENHMPAEEEDRPGMETKLRQSGFQRDQNEGLGQPGVWSEQDLE